MKAFLNDIKVKDKYTSRVLAHFEADEIIKGKYWENGKGCAIGCTIHDSNHARYETELGIPQWLAKLEDKIFESLPDEHAKHWPSKFLNVIHVGADLERIKAPLLIFILKSTLDKFDHKKNPAVLKAVENIIAFYERGDASAEDFRQAQASAYAAAHAYSAAAAAAYAAADAAYSAAAAADAAYAAADAAYTDAAHASAARQDAYMKLADELLRLMAQCVA